MQELFLFFYIFLHEILFIGKIKDIVTFNVSYFHKQASNWLILGENDYFYFVYGAEPKMYALVDRDTLEIENSDKDFSSILEEILRIE